MLCVVNQRLAVKARVGVVNGDKGLNVTMEGLVQAKRRCA